MELLNFGGKKARLLWLLTIDMGRQAKYQTHDYKKPANAEAARKKRAELKENEQKLLSRHPDAKAVLARGKQREEFLREIREGEVTLIPDAPESNVTGVEGGVDGTSI
jgi:hypothetical protein